MSESKLRAMFMIFAVQIINLYLILRPVWQFLTRKQPLRAELFFRQ